MCKVLCEKKAICAIFKCELPFREGESGVNIYGTNPDNKMQILLQLRQKRQSARFVSIRRPNIIFLNTFT